MEGPRSGPRSPRAVAVISRKGVDMAKAGCQVSLSPAPAATSGSKLSAVVILDGRGFHCLLLHPSPPKFPPISFQILHKISMEGSQGGDLRLYFPVVADIDILDLSLHLNLKPCHRRNVVGEIILFLPEENPALESLNLDLNAGIIDRYYPAVVSDDSLDLSLGLNLGPCDRRNVAGEIDFFLPEASPESLNLDLNMGGGGGDLLEFLLGDGEHIVPHFPAVVADGSLDSSLRLDLEPCDRRRVAGEINFLLPEEGGREAGAVLESPNLDLNMGTVQEDLTVRLQLSASRHYSTVENGLLPNPQNNENLEELEGCSSRQLEESSVRVSSRHGDGLTAAASHDENINVKKRSRADIPDPTRHDEPRTKNIKPSPAVREN